MNALKILATLAFFLAAARLSVADHCKSHDCPQCGCKTCVATPETTKVKKHCWEINCKEICIPRFKWPWQSCCQPPANGRVKTVKVLSKKEFECEKCGYQWSVQSLCQPREQSSGEGEK